MFLGGPPALILAAVAPLPENVPELMLASLIAGDGCAVDRARRHPHPLVADAEFALIGEVAPQRAAARRALRRPLRLLLAAARLPGVPRAARRPARDAIYPATVVGKPRQEDFFIGDLLQELLSPLFPLVMPAVARPVVVRRDRLPLARRRRRQQRYAREAMTSAFRILGEGQLSLTKFLLVTDQPVDLRDFRATLEHVLARTHPETDLYVFSNLSMDTLDYTGPEVNKGSKGVWLGLGDPVRELPGEFVRPSRRRATSPTSACSAAAASSSAAAYAEDPDAAPRLARHPAFAGWPLVVLTDEPARAATSAMNFLWTTFTRFEPARDIHAAATGLVRHHLSYTAPIVIDARLKPWFPDELFCAPEVAATVTRRWREYFPSGVEMGDSDRRTWTAV